MSLFPGEVGPHIYPRGQRSYTGSLGVLWGVGGGEGGISIQREGGRERESLYNNKKNGGEERRRDRAERGEERRGKRREISS